MKHLSSLAVGIVLIVWALSAAAQTEPADVVVKEVRKLDGQPVRIQMSTHDSHAGRGSYEVELAFAIGDEPPLAFHRRMSETRPSLEKKSSVEGAWFTVSYSSQNEEHLCDRESHSIEHWGFDTETGKPHLVRREDVDDGEPSLTRADLAAIERGERPPVLNHCSGYSDEQMVSMLRAAERGVRKLHEGGDARKAASRVKRLLEQTAEKSGFLALAAQGPSKENALKYEEAGFLTKDGKFRICGTDHYDYTTTVDGCTKGWVDAAGKHAWLATNFGYYLSEGGEHELAVEVLLAASRAYPEHTPLWLNLGDAHRALGHKAAASTAYERYVEQREARGESVPERVRRFLQDQTSDPKE